MGRQLEIADKFLLIPSFLYQNQRVRAIFVLPHHGDALTYKRVDRPDEWIHICEWGFIGKGMVNRRDYEFSYLVGEGEPDDLFSDLPCETYAPVHFLKLSAEAYGEQLQS